MNDKHFNSDITTDIPLTIVTRNVTHDLFIVFLYEVGADEMKIEIFKAGTQTDSAGNSRAWTEADLDTIASSYDPLNHEAPVCIGHPKDNAPAYGWVKSVTREGKSLFAEIGDLVGEFSDMLNLKMFKKRSISLYPDLSLRHIGFLGAMPPAVKGLKDFAFAEAPAGFEYMDWESSYSLNNVGRLFQRLRDWLIDSKDLATADNLIPQYEIDTLKAIKATDDAAGAMYADTSTEDNDMDKVKELEAQVVTFTEKLAIEAAKATEATTRAATAEARVIVLEKEKTRGELVSFCDRMVGAGKMLPAKKNNHLAIMESLHGIAETDFSEGGTSVKKTPLTAYQESIETGAALVHFGEVAVKGQSGEDMNDAVKIAALATAYQFKMAQTGVEITVSEAVEFVTKQA